MKDKCMFCAKTGKMILVMNGKIEQHAHERCIVKSIFIIRDYFNLQNNLKEMCLLLKGEKK